MFGWLSRLKVFWQFSCLGNRCLDAGLMIDRAQTRVILLTRTQGGGENYTCDYVGPAQERNLRLPCEWQAPCILEDTRYIWASERMMGLNQGSYRVCVLGRFEVPLLLVARSEII